MPTRTRNRPVELAWRDGERSVLVTDQAEDRFVTTVEAAICACKALPEMGRFKAQYRVLLDRLADWLEVHLDRLETAYITIRDAGLLFLVVTKANTYDHELEEKLLDLDIEIARDEQLDLIRLTVLAIPDSSAEGIASFTDPVHTLEFVHAN